MNLVLVSLFCLLHISLGPKKKALNHSEHTSYVFDLFDCFCAVMFLFPQVFERWTSKREILRSRRNGVQSNCEQFVFITLENIYIYSYLFWRIQSVSTHPSCEHVISHAGVDIYLIIAPGAHKKPGAFVTFAGRCFQDLLNIWMGTLLQRILPTRWAPTSYKWPYKWVTGVLTPISGNITVLITC